MKVAEILSDLASLRACVCPAPSITCQMKLRASTIEQVPCMLGSKTNAVQDYNDALNLVTVNQILPSVEKVDQNTTGQSASKSQQAEMTKDHLRLASELVELHYEMKAVHKDGRVDDQLRRGREEVNRVLRELAGR
ncbi:hypothetical protein BJX63DRAFT_390849 [Aspergillus granulosus]|uniref:Uncharacterized protein n=1 Tax=Aspergillus granulosus TaxID=176169 RepID=A0ABR4HHQ5_9EURO